MSRAIRRCCLAVEDWVQSQVASCDVLGGPSENVTWFPQGFFTFPPLIIIVPLLHIYLTLLSEACDVPYQTKHDHNIGFCVGDSSPPHQCGTEITKSFYFYGSVHR